MYPLQLSTVIFAYFSSELYVSMVYLKKKHIRKQIARHAFPLIIFAIDFVKYSVVIHVIILLLNR